MKYSLPLLAIGLVPLGIAIYVWITRSPADPWFFITFMLLLGGLPIGVGIFILLSFDHVAISLASGDFNWRVVRGVPIRRFSGEISELKMLRATLRFEWPVAFRTGIVLAHPSGRLVEMVVGDESFVAKRVSEMPDRLRESLDSNKELFVTVDAWLLSNPRYD